MDTRERLLDATVHCLAADGWARTTTRRIVAQAGAHLPDVRYYFGGKDGLMLEAAVYAARRWAGGALSDMSAVRADDPRTQLEEVLGRFRLAMEGDRSDAVAAVEAFAQLERSPELREEMATAYRDFRAEVSSGVAHGAGVETGPLTLNAATVLMALFDGLAIQWLIDPELLPPDGDLVEALSLMSTALASGG